MGVYVFTDRLAFAATDWCLCLHGWPIMPLLLGVYVFTDQPPRMTPTGAIVFTAGHVAATANRRHHLQRKLSMSAADWLVHLHGCASSTSLTGVIVIAGLPLAPPMVSSLSWLAYSAAVFVFIIILLLPSPTGFSGADWSIYLHDYTSSPLVFFCCR
jgi:hypothetical protein